jgi:4-hydroxy-tetrahydrodipicolinate synthase
MDASVFTHLAEQNIIAGIKDTTCTVEGIQSKQDVAGDVIIYQANTAYLNEALDMGVKGIMAITSTTRTDLVKAFWDAYHAGDSCATSLHRELVFLDMLLRTAYPATAKYIARLQGLEMSTYTRWDVHLTDETCRSIDAWYQHQPETAPHVEKEISDD